MQRPDRGRDLLHPLAAAICTTQPDDKGAVDALCQQLLCVIPDLRDEDTAADAPAAESLLSCILESFLRAGEHGKEVLDQLLLDVLPQLAALAPLSEGCAQAVAAFCSLAAAACTPRDIITAFLEVMDQQIAGRRLNPAAIQFLCGLLVLLPQQLGRLSRRKAAFAAECVVPAAALAKAHGKVLNSWVTLQLQQAASAGPASGSSSSDSAGDDPVAVWRRVSTFLAANWQIYAEFVRDVLLKVLPSEPDAAARLSAQQAMGKLILELFLHLTAAWQPLQLKDMALQLLTPAAAAQLPTAESVTAPVALLTLSNAKQQAQQAAAGQPAGAECRGSADAEDALLALLGLLHGCGIASWSDLASCKGYEAGGAALAAVYSSWLEQQLPQQQVHFQLPSSATETIQLACSWSLALFEASEGSPLVILKAIALLQVAAQHVHPSQISDVDSAAVGNGQHQQAAPLPGTTDSDEAAAMQLLPSLQPCISALASIIAQAAALPLRVQATLAMQQLLRALQPGPRYCCLQQLLSGASRVEPEVAALLMQEVRLQMAQPDVPGIFFSSSCMQLVLPWLQQSGPGGWQNPDVLAQQANAVCAALAVVRLGLLKSQRSMAPAGGALSGASTGDSGGYGGTTACVRRQLLACLPALATAVTAVLRHLQQDNTADEATGAGHAVDAWLAVSRLQDVLDRVLELL